MTNEQQCAECPYMVERIKSVGFSWAGLSLLWGVVVLIGGFVVNNAIAQTEFRKDIESIQKTQIEEKIDRENQEEKDMESRAMLASSIDNLAQVIHKMQLENARMYGSKLDRLRN